MLYVIVLKGGININWINLISQVLGENLDRKIIESLFILRNEKSSKGTKNKMYMGLPCHQYFANKNNK